VKSGVPIQNKENMEMGRGIPHPIRGMGSAVNSPSGIQGGAPAENGFSVN